MILKLLILSINNFADVNNNVILGLKEKIFAWTEIEPFDFRSKMPIITLRMSNVLFEFAILSRMDSYKHWG